MRSSPRLRRLAAVGGLLLSAFALPHVRPAEAIVATPAELVSVRPASSASIPGQDSQASISGDGNIVAFSTETFGEGTSLGAYVRDRGAPSTTDLVALSSNLGVAQAASAVVSRDGCTVAFFGQVFGVTATRWDVYIWRRCTSGIPVRVTTLPIFSTYGPLSLSDNGGKVVVIIPTASITVVDTAPPFARTDLPLANVKLRAAYDVDISGDGTVVAAEVTSLSNLNAREIVSWPVGGSIQFMSNDASGNLLSTLNIEPTINGDGSIVAFSSNQATGYQIYVKSPQPVAPTLVTTASFLGSDRRSPDITPDGSRIAFDAREGNETPAEVWVATTTNNLFIDSDFELVSYAANQPNVGAGGYSIQPAISTDGTYVAFDSDSSDVLAGSKIGTDQNVFVRERVPDAPPTGTLTITTLTDFGSVTIGATSGPKNVVITNTGDGPVTMTSIGLTSPRFTVVTDGCTGVTLQPGASCVVTVTFSPTAAGALNASVQATGSGSTVIGRLRGTGTARPVTRKGLLTITPTAFNFGTGLVGVPIAASGFTVKNVGTAPTTIAGVSLAGADAAQFEVVTTTCPGATLAVNATCAVTVRAKQGTEGIVTAQLVVTSTDALQVVSKLTSEGKLQPTLKFNPAVVRPGDVTTLIGAGFPANTPVGLVFDGDTAILTVMTDDDGGFRHPEFILRNGFRIGGTFINVIDPVRFFGVRAPLLIDQATYRPAGSTNPAFTNGVRAMVSRFG